MRTTLRLPRRLFGTRPTPQPQARGRHRLLPLLERCEDRTLMAAYLVNSLADSGPAATGSGSGTSGDLRYCILQANQNGGTIDFAVTGRLVTSASAPLPALGGAQAIAVNGPGAGLLTVQGNATTGAAIFRVAAGTTVAFSGLTVTGGNATLGGGLYNQGTVGLSGMTFTGNNAYTGGAIRNDGTLTMTSSSVVNNTGGFGAGLFVADGASVAATASTLAGNAASNFGGGVYSTGSVTLSGVTLANNNGGGGGGGVISGGTLVLVDATVAGNTATSNAGVWNTTATASATLTNTIVATNTLTGTATGSNLGGFNVVASSGSNLIGVGGSGGLTNGANGNLVGVANPGLGTLGNYGGPTQTIRLLAGSPALDAGSAATGATFDQRGAVRGPGGVAAGSRRDIGAYEASSSYLVTSAADDGTAGTLRAAVSWANASTNPLAPAGTANFVAFDAAGAFAAARTIALDPDLGTLNLAATTGVPIAVAGPAARVTLRGGGASSNFSVLGVSQGTTAALSDLTVTGGRASFGGGINNAGSLTLTGSTITGNSATSAGGALANVGTLTVTGSTITGNSAPGGGGVNNNSTLTIARSTLSGNSATAGDGGGLLSNGTVTVTSSTLSGNSATASGGGVRNFGRLTVTGSTVNGNTANSNYGGGIDNPGTLTVTGSTVTGNAAQSGGGVNSDGTLTVTGSTIAGNSATAGGGLRALNGIATLVNTIVARNTITGATTASDVVGSLAGTSSNNLIGTGGSGGLANGANGNLVGVADPGLGTLGSYGGPTQTIPLLPGSPALDRGTAAGTPAADQRGAQRGSAGRNAGSLPDIGAYEASSSYLVTSAADDGSVGTLRAGIAWANASTNQGQLALGAPNTVTFDAAGAFAAARTIALDPALSTLNLATTTGVPIAVAGPAAARVTLQGGGASANFRVLSVSRATTATLANLTITGGRTDGDGGGIDSDGVLTLTNSTVSGNSGRYGGGIRSGGSLTLIDSAVSGNTAGPASGSLGGGIFSTGALTLDGSIVAGNSAYNGAGIASTGALTLIDASIRSNAAENSGGGVVVLTDGTATITTSTLAGNSAGNVGGGLYSIGTVTLVGSTLANNSAGNSGGGIISGGTIRLVHTTVARNSAGSGAGLWNTADAQNATLINSIIAANTLTNSPSASDIRGSVNAASANNLIGTGGSGGLANGANGNLVGVADPGLGTLGSYGGPTQTIPLLPGSPALDAGSNAGAAAAGLTSDQRGLARNNNGTVDIGAFESRGFLVAASPGSLTASTLVGTAFAQPIAATVTSPFGEPVAGGVVRFALLPGFAAGATLGVGASATTIDANGQARTYATANGVAGTYALTASVGGPAVIASILTNQAATVGGSVNVTFGTAGVATLLTDADGLRLLPAGRRGTLPWQGLRTLTFTLAGNPSLTASDIRVVGATGTNYGPVSLSRSGSTFTVTLARTIDDADRITLTIANAGINPFSRRLDVLPGDVNDDGQVDATDATLARNAVLSGVVSLNTDLDGDGAVTIADYNLARRKAGTRLPAIG